jgi:hypothetical protein
MHRIFVLETPLLEVKKEEENRIIQAVKGEENSILQYAYY